MSTENKKRYSAIVGHDGKAYIGVSHEEEIYTSDAIDEGNSLKPTFGKRWWSSDREGKTHIDEGRLEDTVYFHVITEYIPVGTEIKFQLWDYDAIYLGLLTYDIVDPDDKEFNGKEIYKTGKVYTHNGKERITLELKLDPEWEQDLADDKFVLDSALDLYWTWSYNSKNWDSEDTICKAKFSERTLYIQPMNELASPMPELYDRAGKLILTAFGETNGKVEHFVTMRVDVKNLIKRTSFLTDINALKTELYLENINIAEGKQDITLLGSKTELSDFKLKTDAIFETTLDQKSVPVTRSKKFSEYFNVYDAWGYTKQVGDAVLKVFDFINLTEDILNLLPKDGGVSLDVPKSSTVAGFLSTGLSVSAPALARRFSVIGFGLLAVEWLAADLKAESDAQLTEGFAEDMERAKAEGLDAVRQYIDSIDHELFTWKLMPISYETLAKLLQGEFKTFDDLRATDINPNETLVEVLYRKTKNNNRDEFIYTIETIFINE